MTIQCEAEYGLDPFSLFVNYQELTVCEQLGSSLDTTADKLVWHILPISGMDKISLFYPLE